VNRGEVLNYWLNRLAPLLGSDVHFVCANRIGVENGVTFSAGGYNRRLFGLT